MKRLGVVLALVAGCQPFGRNAQYQCVTSADCDGTSFPVCDAAKHLCVAVDGGTGSTTGSTTGGPGTTTGSTTGGTVGTSGSNGTSSGSSTGTTSGPVSYPSFQGAAIKQLVPFDGGIFAVGTSLWFNDGSDGGAWTEVLNAPADAGSLLEIAENVYLSVCDEASEWLPYDGFSLQRLLAEDGVLVAQVDVESASVDAGLQRGSNFYVECPTCSDAAVQLLGSDWLPLRQYSPGHFDDRATASAISSAPQASFFVYLQNGQSEAYTYDALTGDGVGSSSTFSAYLFGCGSITAAPSGPAFLASLSSPDGGANLTMLGVDPLANAYTADAGTTLLPADYRPTQSNTPGCPIGTLNPIFAASFGGSVDAGVVLVGGWTDGGGTGVWAVPYGPGAAAPSFLTALPAGNLQFALGPGGVWAASGEGVAVIPLATPLVAQVLPAAPDTITALGQLGDRMLAGTGNGVLDITTLATDAPAAPFTANGLDGVELDAFGQGVGILYALSGSGTQETRFWHTDSTGSFQMPHALDGGCQSIIDGNQELLGCGDTAALVLGGIAAKFSPVQGQVVIQGGTGAYGVVPPNVVNVFNFGESDGPIVGTIVLDGMNQPAVGPLWGTPAFGNGANVYAYSADGGFEILQPSAVGGGATATLAVGGLSPVPGVAGTVDPLNGSVFVLPDPDAGRLYDCQTKDAGATGFSVACEKLCQVKTTVSGQLDLQFDVAGNLWVLSHVAANALDADLIEDASALYAIPSAQVLAGSSGGSACPSVPLQFITRPGDAPLDYVYVASATMNACMGQSIPAGGPIQEGLLGFGVTPLDGGPIYFRGTRHPLSCVPQVTDAGFSCALSIVP